MESIPALVALARRALLLDGDAYRKMSERPAAARDGAWLLLLLGAALGLAATAAAIVAWATSPSVAEVQRVLQRELWALPLWRWLGLEAASLQALAQRHEWIWLLGRWQRPAPLLALPRLFLTPLNLFAGWLAYGLLAQGLARLLGGRGGLGRTLGAAALAESPRVLLLVPFLPPLGPAGLGIWAWVLAARFQALRAAHGLDGWRTFWATLLPSILLAGAIGLLLALGAVAAAWAARMAG